MNSNPDYDGILELLNSLEPYTPVETLFPEWLTAHAIEKYEFNLKFVEEPVNEVIVFDFSFISEVARMMPANTCPYKSGKYLQTAVDTIRKYILLLNIHKQIAEFNMFPIKVTVETYNLILNQSLDNCRAHRLPDTAMLLKHLLGLHPFFSIHSLTLF